MIRKIRKEDKSEYVAMAKDFYSSDAVCRNIPEKYFDNTFHELMRSDNYADAYIIEFKNIIAGYALLAKTFSQEAGGMTLWIDEIYIKPEYRGHGLGHEFFQFLKRNIQSDIKRVRLEVDGSNEKAISLYQKIGFENLPYCQMIKDF